MAKKSELLTLGIVAAVCYGLYKFGANQNNNNMAGISGTPKKTATVEFKESFDGYDGKIYVDGRHIANVNGSTIKKVVKEYKSWCTRNGYKPEKI